MLSRDKSLELVTSEQRQPTEKNPRTLYVSGGIDDPQIAYLEYTSGGYETSDVVVFNKDKTSVRPLKSSELKNRLRNRYWNKVDGCRYIDSDGNLYYRTYSFDSVRDRDAARDMISNDLGLDVLKENIDNSENNLIAGKFFLFKINDSKYSGLDNECIGNTYHEQFGNGNSVETMDTYRGVSSQPAMNQNKTVDLIKENSSTYTNIIDFNPILYKTTAKGITVSASVCVKYSISGQIYCLDVIVPVFEAKINERGNLEKTMINTIEDNGDISVEYINGVLKAIPIKVSIDECIISSCSLVYGTK